MRKSKNYSTKFLEKKAQMRGDSVLLGMGNGDGGWHITVRRFLLPKLSNTCFVHSCFCRIDLCKIWLCPQTGIFILKTVLWTCSHLLFFRTPLIFFSNILLLFPNQLLFPATFCFSFATICFFLQPFAFLSQPFAFQAQNSFRPVDSVNTIKLIILTAFL